jgi:2-hydroxycyclohexanecarboxyl-CoA dehydrogenase
VSVTGEQSGRNAVVTGAASGIGRAIALALAAEGGRVAAADLDLEGAEETAAQARGAGGEMQAFAVDVTDAVSVGALRDAIEAALGPVDVVVNNAGWTNSEPFLENTPELWSRVVAINFIGPMTVAHTFLKPLVAAGRPGAVVNVASDAGRVGSTGETSYAGAKGGVIAFTKSLAREMARHGVTVNSVSPGPTDTPMLRRQPEKFREALVRAVPLRRFAAPEDIAAAVCFFASPRASYITGQVLSVSGGLTMVD